MFDQSVFDAAKQHARKQFPFESCGLVINGVYHPCANVAPDPERDFVIDPRDQVAALKKGRLQAVIHSHPKGPIFPSKADMIGQLETNVPWGIVPLDEDRIADPFFWGGTAPIRPILGREFQHGITDCYAVMRDVYRLGKEKLAEQDIEWPFDPILFPEIPRDDEWWTSGDDLYSGNFEKLGFHPIDISDARPGDVFLVKLRSNKLNHGGLLMPSGLILHHLPGRMSRREPAGLWARSADMWLRYEASNAA